jgi:hypothetical protein
MFIDHLIRPAKPEYPPIKVPAGLDIELPEFDMPDYEESVHQIIGPYILFTSLCQDYDAEDPTNWEGTGKIWTFMRGYTNTTDIDPRRALGEWICPECGADDDYIEDLESHIFCHYCEYRSEDRGEWWKKYFDRIPLSYFEHGQCRWGVAGSMDHWPDAQWDLTRYAGFWEPDESVEECAEMKGFEYGSDERIKWMRRQAQEACKLYTCYCNGWVYGFVIEAYETRLPYDQPRDYRHDAPVFEDHGFSIYDDDGRYIEEETHRAWITAVESLLNLIK